ncbi:hypothetical protein N7530_000345 [Penicillium desertorum]|uniref:Uncharacterized protein n=1 Tax=Penicillium desertorum TaxID=1303715 RepID=A0A9X0BVU9_9EURO|nr:hypothetical protein N7530_000345 [Penicillium desertorum]
MLQPRAYRRAADQLTCEIKILAYTMSRTVPATRRIDNTKYTISGTKSSKLGASCKVQQDPRGRQLFSPQKCSNRSRHSAEQRYPINRINIARFGLATGEFRTPYSHCIVAGNSANNARSRQGDGGLQVDLTHRAAKGEAKCDFASAVCAGKKLGCLGCEAASSGARAKERWVRIVVPVGSVFEAHGLEEN